VYDYLLSTQSETCESRLPGQVCRQPSTTREADARIPHLHNRRRHFGDDDDDVVRSLEEMQMRRRRFPGGETIALAVTREVSIVMIG